MVLNMPTTVINCSDGTVQEPVSNWVTRQVGARLVSVVSPVFGPDDILSHGSSPRADVIKQSVLHSLERHGSKMIVFAGHEGCTGNAASKMEHIKEIKESCTFIASWVLPGKPDIVGLWVDAAGTIEVVYDSRVS